MTFRVQKDRLGVDLDATALHVAAAIIVDTRGTAVQEYFHALEEASARFSQGLCQPGNARYRMKLGFVEAGTRGTVQRQLQAAQLFRIPFLRFGGSCNLAGAVRAAQGMLARQEEEWAHAAIPFARSAMFFIHRYSVEEWAEPSGRRREMGCGIVTEPASFVDCALANPRRMTQRAERAYWERVLDECFGEIADELKRRIGVAGTEER